MISLKAKLELKRKCAQRVFEWIHLNTNNPVNFAFASDMQICLKVGHVTWSTFKNLRNTIQLNSNDKSIV